MAVVFGPSIEPRQCSNRPIDKGFVQLPALCRFAGLHSLYKGANKRRRDRRLSSFPRTRGGRPDRHRALSLSFLANAFSRVLRGGWAAGQRGTWTVTAISAEPTRRDFPLHRNRHSGRRWRTPRRLVPLIAQMNPDASTIGRRALRFEVDLTPIAVGQVIKVVLGAVSRSSSATAPRKRSKRRANVKRLEPARPAG